MTRKKNEVGYPKRSIEECLKISKIDTTELTKVVIASNFMHHPSYLQDVTPWYLVGKKEQDRAEKISNRYHEAVFLKRKTFIRLKYLRWLEYSLKNLR